MNGRRAQTVRKAGKLQPIKYGQSKTTREFVDKLDLSRKQRAELAEEHLPQAMFFIGFASAIIGRGGNIHGVNHRATAKRRAANRRARRQRRVNRIG